jgi:MFS superfamily sulfate permease-like transporter
MSFLNKVTEGFTLRHLTNDFPASVTVFFVALPLCLGIALASGAPLIAGIIAGIVGGIIVGTLSNSTLSVSGPAAGLTTIVVAAITDLGSFQLFLLAVVLAGAVQLTLGYLKAGTIGHFFPSAVIKGMLTAIGFILILKQIPHAIGYDHDFEGDETFLQPDGENTLSEIISATNAFSAGAIIIALISFLVLWAWEKIPRKKITFLPASLVVVLVGVVINQLLGEFFPDVQLQNEHLVSIVLNETSFQFPDLKGLANPEVYVAAVTIALVASLESLLSIEATDKLDPSHKITPLNHELKAQGIGNMVSGLFGGLPITAVIVRSSANISAGARSKLSTILHGVLLTVAVTIVPSVLNLIPLSCLAAILITIGWKLVNIKQLSTLFRNGIDQLLPFVVTVVAILLTDLLIGISIGILVGVIFVLKTNFHKAITIINDKSDYLLKLNKDVSFLNKAILRKYLEAIPNKSYVIIDGGNSQFIDHDIIETLEDFIGDAPNREIQIEIKKSVSSTIEFFKK